MKFEKSISILYSSDIVTSLNYYIEKLEFDEKWEWDNPPTFGGVRKQDVEIFFCKNDQGNPGTWLCILIENVDEYYKTIKNKGAKIITEPQNREFNIREMLVEDPDGHIIRFGHRIECE